MYEVLAEIARRRRGSFNAHEIAQVVGRHPSQVQRDLDRLLTIGVLEPAPAQGAAKPLRPRRTQLARAVIALPLLIERELGNYPRDSVPDPRAYYETS
jgi:predicted transcriptional regulator